MLNPIYDFVARAIVSIHGVLVHVFGHSGWSWALSIVLLVMAVRLVMFPLFVKQIKAQRTMQLMQPKIKELKDKYKNDKQKMNEEMIKLQREHGNPLLGCLPIVVQIPLFLSLFRVMNGFAPKGGLTAMQKQVANGFGGYYPTHLNGLSVSTASEIAHAKIFGASIASSFTSSHRALVLLGSDGLTTKILCVVLIAIMMSTTFLTQKQIMGRNAPADAQSAATQKILLYLSPLFLGVFGFRFSVGVLLYWFTTNLWSMGQQFFVIRRMPPIVAAGGTALPSASAGPVSKPTGGLLGGLLGGRAAAASRAAAEPAVGPQRMIQQRPAPASAGPSATGSGPSGPRPTRAASNGQRRRKGGRRGGRH